MQPFDSKHFNVPFTHIISGVCHSNTGCYLIELIHCRVTILWRTGTNNYELAVLLLQCWADHSKRWWRWCWGHLSRTVLHHPHAITKTTSWQGLSRLMQTIHSPPPLVFPAFPHPQKKKKVALAWGLLWVLTAYQLFQHVLYPTLTI